jgi:hypothetical protein
MLINKLLDCFPPRPARGFGSLARSDIREFSHSLMRRYDGHTLSTDFDRQLSALFPKAV